MTQKFNPYQEQIKNYRQQLENNQGLLTDPAFADPAMQKLAKDEITRLEQELKTLELAAKKLSNTKQVSTDPTQLTKTANAIVEIRGGAGGDEAKIWATELMRMYLRFCDNYKLKVELIDDLVFKVKGKVELTILKLEMVDKEEKLITTNDKEMLNAFDLLRYESGVHRVQRVPVTESQGRIHTSTASVAVLPEIHAQAIEIKDEDLDVQFMRASGAGGQSVNKTSSAVRLTHKPTGTVVVARSERKQVQNRQIAMELLRAKLWTIEEEKRQQILGTARENIGRNMRAEKIRTYNFPQNRITDHRIKRSWFNLEGILDGDLKQIISEFRAYLTPTV